jgi:hypothetical protein
MSGRPVDKEARWDVPFPYGYTAAIDSMGTIAAPLLAGFSVALAAVVLTTPSSFHWHNACASLLTGAMLALIATVQFAFRARQYAVTPADLEVWWSTDAEAGTRSVLRRTQRYHKREFERWSNRARMAYNAGLVLFLAGVVAMLAPHKMAGMSLGRLLPPGLATVGLLIELGWIATTAHQADVKNWPEEPGPEF